jgi:hypothetical protein
MNDVYKCEKCGTNLLYKPDPAYPCCDPEDEKNDTTERDINGVPIEEYLGPTFSINKYDRDGDVYEEGIYLHYMETTIRVATTIEGFKAHIKSLDGMVQEIEENLKG